MKNSTEKLSKIVNNREVEAYMGFELEISFVHSGNISIVFFSAKNRLFKGDKPESISDCTSKTAAKY